MKDRSVQFPNRYRLVPVQGTSDIVDIVPAPGEVTEVGTEVNKATLLKDATAAKLGLGVSALPDDAVLALINRVVTLTNKDVQLGLEIANRQSRQGYTTFELMMTGRLV